MRIDSCACVMQCSFSVCLRNREESYKAVERYVDEWRAKKQQPFRCYYDTMSLDTVIVEKMYSTADVVHRSASIVRASVAFACPTTYRQLCAITFRFQRDR